MKLSYQKLLVLAALSLPVVSAPAQTSPIYINHGDVEEAPQIDATAFYNDGTFNLLTSYPFRTLNTRHYTNRGTLIGGPGFFFSFDSGDQSGPKMADSFVNEGSVIARDSVNFGLISDPDGGQIIVPTAGGVSWLEIEATKVFTSGLLSAGVGGRLNITAKQADLSRAGVRTGTLPGTSGVLFFDSDSVTASASNYINPFGITDAYWAQGTNQVLSGNGNPLALNTFPPTLNTPFPETPSHEVTSQLGSSNGFFRSLPAFNNDTVYSASVHTNASGGSNVVIQVVFVATNINNGQITANVKWANGNIGGRAGLNGAWTPVIEVSGRVFDRSLNRYTTNSIYVIDQIASFTNTFTAVNFNGTTGRPVNYRTAIGAPGAFRFLDNGNSFFNYFNHIYNFTWTYGVVTNGYTAYSFNLYDTPQPTLGVGIIGNIPTRGFNLGNPFVENWFDPTNLPGRVSLNIDGALDLQNTRIRGENYVEIDTPHIEFNDRTIFDAPAISMALGRTNENSFLQLSNTIPSTVERLGGPIYLWSASWTNESVSFQFDPDGTVSSNVTTILNYVTFVDGENIAGEDIVTTTELALHADEIVVSDDLFLQKKMEFHSPTVTLDSVINISSEVGRVIDESNFIGTTVLTNRGSFFQGQGSAFAGSAAEIGPRFNPPLDIFQNPGSWTASYFDILAREFGNSGTIFAYQGPLITEVDTMDITQGEMLSNNDVYLSARTLTNAFSTVRAGILDDASGSYYRGTLHINIAESVEDGGAGANNVWDVTDGFRMPMKPARGDFLGTRLYSFGYEFHEVRHTWGAEDRGMDASGWMDNAAVGRLILDGQPLSLFTFQTVNTNNAMYVENLELRGDAAAFPVDSINIEDGMKIYYSNVVGSTPTELEAVNKGRDEPVLIYFPRTTLPATTEITLANGQSFVALDNLLSSVVVDSDADGIVNGEDESPFDDVKIDVTVFEDPEPKAVISWAGAPRTEYELQYKNDVVDANWQSLTNFVTMSDQRDMTVTDSDPDSAHRYYRVIYTP